MESLGAMPTMQPVQKRGAVDPSIPRIPLRCIAERIHSAAACTSPIETHEAERFSHLLNSKLRYAIKKNQPEDEKHIRELMSMLGEIHPRIVAAPKKGNNRKEEHHFVDRSCDWVWRLLRERQLKDIMHEFPFMKATLQRKLKKLEEEILELRKKRRSPKKIPQEIGIAQASKIRVEKALDRLETFEQIGIDAENPRKAKFAAQKPLVDAIKPPVDDYDAVDIQWWEDSTYKCSGLRR